MVTVRDEQRIFLRLYMDAVMRNASLFRVCALYRRIQELGTDERRIDRAYQRAHARSPAGPDRVTVIHGPEARA